MQALIIVPDINRTICESERDREYMHMHYTAVSTNKSMVQGLLVMRQS